VALGAGSRGLAPSRSARTRAGAEGVLDAALRRAILHRRCRRSSHDDNAVTHDGCNAQPAPRRWALVNTRTRLVRGGHLDRRRGLVTDDLIVYRAEPDGATSHGLDGFSSSRRSGPKASPIGLRRSPRWDNGSWCAFANRPMARRAAYLPRTTSWFVYEFRGGRIERMSISYAHETEALEAAGLLE
jgi:hypothetical protein